MKTLLIRVTNLYCPGYEDSFFARAKHCAEGNQTFQLSGSPETTCDFLHVDDLALYIILALDKKSTGIVHLAYCEPFTYEATVAQLQTRLPALQATYLGDAIARPSLQCTLAKLGTDWVPRHRWLSELNEIYTKSASDTGKFNLRRRMAQSLRRLFGSTLPWVELIILGVAAESLLRLSQANVTFRFIDFWLHLRDFDGLSAREARRHYGGSNRLYWIWRQLGRWRVTICIYCSITTIIGFPLVMYLLSGGTFGYLHDKYTDNLESMRMEKEQRDAETEFIQTMYKQVDARP